MASDEAPAAKRSKITRDGRLDGKVVFVTAAAQGIGRASALVSNPCQLGRHVVLFLFSTGVCFKYRLSCLTNP